MNAKITFIEEISKFSQETAESSFVRVTGVVSSINTSERILTLSDRRGHVVQVNFELIGLRYINENSICQVFGDVYFSLNVSRSESDCCCEHSVHRRMVYRERA